MIKLIFKNTKNPIYNMSVKKWVLRLNLNLVNGLKFIYIFTQYVSNK